MNKAFRVFLILVWLVSLVVCTILVNWWTAVGLAVAGILLALAVMNARGEFDD